MVPAAARRHPDRARLADVGPARSRGRRRVGGRPRATRSPTTWSAAATDYARELVRGTAPVSVALHASARVAHDDGRDAGRGASHRLRAAARGGGRARRARRCRGVSRAPRARLRDARARRSSGRVSVVGARRMEYVMARVPVAEGIFTWPSDEPQLIGSRCTDVRHRHVSRAGLVPALRVDRDGRAPAGPARPALGVDDPGLPAAVAAVRGPDGQRLRAVRRRLRRASPAR